MPLDAVYLTQVANELRSSLEQARIDKIHQPTRDEVVLSLHNRQGAFRLLLSANSAHPRAHITTVSMENPASPPMFCMLLRKHLTGGKLLEITQPPMERVLDFSFQCTGELGEEVVRHLVIEIMGRNSNLILLGEDGRIIDCVRRVDYEMSQQRQVLPGLYYHLPPQQEKKNPLTADLAEISALVQAVDTPTRPDEFLMHSFSGLPPLICRELSARFDPELEDVNTLPLSSRYTFAAYLLQEFQKISENQAAPYLLLKNGASWDFTYMPILQYGPLVESQKNLDAFTLLPQEEKKIGEEPFTNDVNQILELLLQECRKRMDKPAKEMNKEEKMEIVRFLDHKGAFLITKSGDKICAFLDISKFTLYSYLDTIRKEDKE